jgi:hypothetical protein
MKRKTTPGQPNPKNPLSKDKESYKAFVLTKPIAVIIPFVTTLLYIYIYIYIYHLHKH